MPSFDKDCLWTDAQKAAFEQIRHLMQEHFDAGCYSCMAEINDHQDETNHNYHGSKAAAIGLHHMAISSLTQNLDDDDPS